MNGGASLAEATRIAIGNVRNFRCCAGIYWDFSNLRSRTMTIPNSNRLRNLKLHLEYVETVRQDWDSRQTGTENIQFRELRTSACELFVASPVPWNGPNNGRATLMLCCRMHRIERSVIPSWLETGSAGTLQPIEASHVHITNFSP